MSGNVQRPGNYEVELGVPARDIIYGLAGGPYPGSRVKAWFPGGSSAPVLTEEHLDLPYDFESMAQAGSMLGSGAIIVVDDTVPIVSVALRLAEFYRHESCGKCVPCREGTNWTVKMLERVDRGEATPMDLDIMASVQENIIGNCLCVLGDSMAMPVGSMIRQFRPEFEAHIEQAAGREGRRSGRRSDCRRAADGAEAAAAGSRSRVDGREVRAPENEWLVDAVKRGDVEVPFFCYEPKLGDPVGACRMCLVEIEGIPKLQTSCSTPVKDGMVVYTQTDRVKHAQNAVVEFLLVNHPLDCPVCDKGGECPLQDISYGWGPGKSRFVEPKRNFPKPIALSPLIAIDRERCILCYRCVRFSQEVAEDNQLAFLERADHTFVGTFDGRPYEAPFSGNIIELCPVGALTNTSYRFRARPWDIEDAGSVCTLCPSQCNVAFTVRDERVERVLARDNARGRRRVAVRQGPLGIPVGRRRRSGSPSRWCATAGTCARSTWERALDGGRRGPAQGRRCDRRAGRATATTNEEALPAPADHPRGARLAATSTRAPGGPLEPATARMLAHPRPGGVGLRHRSRLGRAGARDGPDERGADLRPAPAQGRAAPRHAAGGRRQRARPRSTAARRSASPARRARARRSCARSRRRWWIWRSRSAGARAGRRESGGGRRRAADGAGEPQTRTR